MPQEKMTDYIKPNNDRSVLLTIDMQGDFALPGSPAEIPGTLEIVPTVQKVAHAYRKYKLPIIHVTGLYLPDGSNADLCRRKAIMEGKRIVTPSSAGAELLDALKPNRGTKMDSHLLMSGSLQPIGEKEWILYKPRWGAFYRTTLEDHLHNLEIDTVVAAGCNFPNCPRTTIYEASERDFRIVLITDAVSGLYEQGMRELQNIGVALMAARNLIKWCSVVAA